jgi:HPt (histidine-containing phosphotransfer) domain-containing protein
VLTNRTTGLGPDDTHEDAIAAGPVVLTMSSALDPAALERLRELDPSGAGRLLERVLKAFQNSAGRLRAQCTAARATGDQAAIRLVAHTLKSSSASIGALQLSQLSAQIETTIRNGNIASVESALGADLDAFDRALDETLETVGRLLREMA